MRKANDAMSDLNLKSLFDRLQAEAPLVLSITNQVTINECANGLLAIGASPVMSDDPADAEALAGLASATVLNIGTTNDIKLEVSLAAGRGAKKAGRPVVLDPVGVGATETRRRAAGRILDELKPEIVRGNFSEIKALAGLTFAQKGVDSSETEDARAAADIARALAGRLQCVVAVTGATDVVTDGRTTRLVVGGSPLMTKLTGTGCLLTALVGAYAAVSPDRPADGALAALVHLALAGERAARALPAPTGLGSYRVRLFDELSLIGGEDLEKFSGVSQI